MRHSFSLSNLVPSPKADWGNGCTIGVVFWSQKRKLRLVDTSSQWSGALFMFTIFQLWRSTVGLSIVLTIAPQPGRAVDPDQPAASYIRTTFTVEDGLSSNVVNFILQTRNGFLWIGTDAGLDRFDGRHFTPIYFRGPSPTPQGTVTALAEGLDGDLWIGTSAGLVRIARSALDRFDRSLSVFYHPGPGISDEITWLHCARDGVLWVGTGAGLYRFVGNRFETVDSQCVQSAGSRRARTGTCSSLAARDLSSWTERGSCNIRDCRIN